MFYFNFIKRIKISHILQIILLFYCDLILIYYIYGQNITNMLLYED